MIPGLRGTLTSINTLVRLPRVRCVASSKLPTDHGEFDIHVFKSVLSAKTHVALLSSV